MRYENIRFGGGNLFPLENIRKLLGVHFNVTQVGSERNANPIVWKVEQKDHVIATVCSCLATALTKFPYLANVTCDSKKVSFKDPE